MDKTRKAILKGIRFPPDLLADIEKHIERDKAHSNFSSWVIEACKHQLKTTSNVFTANDDKNDQTNKLTKQKKKFADYMMKGLNQTQCAILAGYSAKTARSKGSQLAKEPCILAYIASKKT
ncbi:hypothetical protein PV0197_4685 [Escherichia coli]|nr:hypothetical protein PV0197_4685 [Escherichia coli]